MTFLKKYSALLLLVIVLILCFGLLFFYEGTPEVDFGVATGGDCNVSVVAINGELDTQDTDTAISSLRIARTIREFENDGNMAVVVLMDSGGGTATAAEEISDALESLTKPSITFVRGGALSGAYWVASATDYIVALGTALVGNIGVTASYLDETKLNENEGYTFEEIVSGKYKEVGNPNRALSEEDREYLQKHADGLFSLFKEAVMKNRDLTEDQFQKVGDAKFYLAGEALDFGLIDAVGGLEETKQALAMQLDTDAEELLFCEPHEFWTESYELF